MVEMNSCEICPLVQAQRAEDDEVLLQTDRWAAVLDRNQTYLGKSFVTLREHKETLSDLDGVDWNELHEVIRKLEYATKRAFGASVLNWECLMNNAILAEQPTHIHWHLYPRYLGGVVFEGEEFPDEKWPRHIEGGKHLVNDELFSKISQKLKEEIYGN